MPAVNAAILVGRLPRGASAGWGEFRQQIFLTRSREEREGKISASVL